MSTSVQARPRPTTAEPGAARRRKRPVARLVTAVVLGVVCVVIAFPLIWMVLTSLRPSNDVFTGGLWPKHVSFDAYREVWSSTDFPSHFLASLWITVATVVLVLLFASLSGYAFAQLSFPFKNVIYLLLLTTLMMPATALILPLYLQLKKFGLLDSQLGLVVLYVSGSAPFAMFLMRAFFETLPRELAQAARIDGASEFQVFWRVILPLTRPGLATVTIFQFLATWNEFLYANTVLRDPGKLTLQPVLFAIVGQYSTNWPVLTAGLVMSVVPVIAVYVWMQRQFVAGMTLGAVKN
ncbi:multiple sugar transport system permease protein/raffinose/stachyose/melibiose transport system permease protein/arabinogalactan oligomer/maltooligosaccharide transport system permease protein [Motilibacter peucedani]|uniref:Multiple sugar transport system permease protein/raffinose/stachyose/melibiose transport system permease protein/arabinogalactan oligomer/maltooligosaccharide transport system permease protein n=1 Tax=Motilibacter peucedani TaxID=598650 RepID=A0A420XKR1_9ACTN|nr:carbohydrate ABC transporter permease [Motilibacter peucedani]RKS69189.1 multiple sugar transport system permease protein/raffinose/stachyose/melibiose transport system permease protein/arabinogalactan oligomer/maltooligosaccharide transport system permease protein [Motilibacter peucedani]